MIKQTSKNKKGFTLIELMIVVAIIGILAAIAIPNFIRFQLKSKSSEGKVNLAAIRTAEEGYMAEFGSYVAAGASPAAAPGSAKGTFTDTGAAGANFDTLGWAPEGNVYFSYGVGIGTANTFTATAQADIDGDSTAQVWGYKKSTTGGAAGDETLVHTCATTTLNTVVPCTASAGSSVF
ncbi:MAG: prepilin-type N-terminal cleavage/methylation domain-containing protein [Myxococcota bacterium]|nr:prepilin-type N-terminal cleavage/methylation domain-containing protein [Myxococcota bacterium]